MAFKDFAKRNWPLFVIIGMLVIGLGAVIYTIVAKSRTGNYVPEPPPALRYYDNLVKGFTTAATIGTNNEGGLLCPNTGDYYKTDVVSCANHGHSCSNDSDCNFPHPSCTPGWGGPGQDPTKTYCGCKYPYHWSGGGCSKGSTTAEENIDSKLSKNIEFCADPKAKKLFYPNLNMNNVPDSSGGSLTDVTVKSSTPAVFYDYPPITITPSVCGGPSSCGNSAKAVATLADDSGPSSIGSIFITKSGNKYQPGITYKVKAESPSGTYEVGTANVSPTAFNYQICQNKPTTITSQDSILTDIQFTEMKNTKPLDSGVSQCGTKEKGGDWKPVEQRCPDDYFPVGSTLSELDITRLTKDCDNQSDGIIAVTGYGPSPSKVGLCYKTTAYDDALASGTQGITDIKILRSTAPGSNVCENELAGDYHSLSGNVGLSANSGVSDDKLYICATKDNLIK